MATSEDDRGEPSKKRSKGSQIEKWEDKGGGGSAPVEVKEGGPDKVSGGRVGGGIPVVIKADRKSQVRLWFS